ncbi:MAG: DUF2017 domain-containing protein [Corynebacterium sp.]|uniref:DUF2017 domain-containing protein n=1 Tax=Corynebacterium sp. TaxID=1720 RepID=UPI0026DD2EB3|nr:DUF2017 domain-containing protein [Corynebacterium sp.]MDO5030733.1 DUF2017 domain-containing protein [Corynebacterium sp.]
MRPWKRKRSILGGGVKYVTTFEGTERDLLLNLAATVADSLMDRARTAPKDELAELTGMPTGHSEAPADPRLARLLPDFAKPDAESVEGENALMRQLHESEIVESKLHSLRAIIDALEPSESGQVSISESDAHAWVAGINDLRIYLHVTMENLQGSIEQIEQADAMYQWLSYNQESLLDQLMGE